MVVWRDGEVEYPARVAQQRGGLLHLGVLPEHDLVLRVAVRGGQLVDVLREQQVAHLRARLHTVQLRARQRVPKPNAPVCRPTSARQQTVLVRRPGQRLHRRLVR